MAKNITILEGGQSRSFGNVEKLETNLVGGGTQYWVPEDEAVDYVDLEDLDVTENGYYEPSGDGFRTVSVEVEFEPDLEEITITENGIYTPSGDGFSSVSVEVDTSGEEGDPSVHGNEITAIAQTDINAGETVAVQDPSNEPVAVSCPLSGISAGVNPFAYDGKNIYWCVGNYADSELRKKPIENIEAERYTTYASKVSGSGYYNPWVLDSAYVNNGLDDDNNLTIGSVFTNRKVAVAAGNTPFVCGKYAAINDKLYDNRMRAVNDAVPGLAYGEEALCISSARYVKKQSNYGLTQTFYVWLLGGTYDQYDWSIPSGYSDDTSTRMTLSQMMLCGTNQVCFVLTDGVDTTKHCIIACEIDAEAEYEGNVHSITPTVVYEWHSSTSIAIGHDTLYDTWGIATDNGLIILHSDLSYDYYENLTATSAPFLAGQYAWLGGSCYKLIGDSAIMVATSSKGTGGVLGVCKSNVKAGEEGTAIVLFS